MKEMPDYPTGGFILRIQNQGKIIDFFNIKTNFNKKEFLWIYVSIGMSDR